MTKTALITGTTGQDGAYLSKLLLEKGYEVYGAMRRSSTENVERLEALGIVEDIHPVTFDLLEFGTMERAIRNIEPDEVYNLAAQSDVAVSFDQPLYTNDANHLGVLRLLEAIRLASADSRFYQASSSEMFGKVHEEPQTEQTPFHPRSPYGVSKLAAHWATINYREAFDLHCSTGICFNHESPLRGEKFVTRKITLALAKIRHKRQEKLHLGNLEAERDWGFAGDYVEGMWRMLQEEESDDYVLATGETHSVREFVDTAAEAAGFDLEWEGQGKSTKGVDSASGNVIVEVDPRFYRPAEVDQLRGDPSKASGKLGWEPNTSFQELVEKMVSADLERVERMT